MIATDQCVPVFLISRNEAAYDLLCVAPKGGLNGKSFLCFPCTVWRVLFLISARVTIVAKCKI